MGTGLLPDHVNFQDEKYWLKQIVFHHGSEHSIDGVQYPLEAQLVHKSVVGSILIVSVLFDMGRENEFLNSLHWKSVPKQGEKMELPAVNPRDIMPTGDLEYYQYHGSFTTPPCTEDVQWVILKKPATISELQVEHFPFLANYRSIQPLNGRKVEFMSVVGRKKPVTAEPMTHAPTQTPTTSKAPPGVPTPLPTLAPTLLPTVEPSTAPTDAPSREPTMTPTSMPVTDEPTLNPTLAPTLAPTVLPTLAPTIAPS